jgi:hypothetical protein
VITIVAIVMGCLFIATYSLALGDPVPHRIDAALVGNPTAHTRTTDSLEGVAGDHLVFRRYASVPAALHAIDEQHVYAALDVTSKRPTLYVASAAGASVARVLERIDAVDPTVQVVDTHPLAANDRNGLDLLRRRRLSAAAPAPLRVHLAVAALRRNRHGAPRRRLLHRPPARAPDRRPGDLGGGAVRRVAGRRTPS